MNGTRATTVNAGNFIFPYAGFYTRALVPEAFLAISTVQLILFGSIVHLAQPSGKTVPSLPEE